MDNIFVNQKTKEKIMSEIEDKDECPTEEATVICDAENPAPDEAGSIH